MQIRLKTENARSGKARGCRKRFSAAPRSVVAVNFAFWADCFRNPPVFAVTAPLPKKSLLCKSFSGARNSPLFLISVGFSYETCAWLGARERSERVTRAASAAPSALPPTCSRQAHVSLSRPYIYRISTEYPQYTFLKRKDIEKGSRFM